MRSNQCSVGGVLLRVALLACSALMPALAQADDFQGLGFLPSGTYSQAFGVSADGSVIVGTGNSTVSGAEAFRWTSSAGIVGLGVLPGDS